MISAGRFSARVNDFKRNVPVHLRYLGDDLNIYKSKTHGKIQAWNSKSNAANYIRHAVTEEDEENFEKLRAFRNSRVEDDLTSELEFPPSLTSKQRASIHSMCEKLGLGHKSSGIGDQRQLKVWHIPLEDRISNLENALKAEEAASRTLWEQAMSGGSDDEMERAGFLLRSAIVSGIELTSFGRAKYTLSEDRNRVGHMRLFNVRAGSPVVAAVKNSKTGVWAAAPGARPGFVVGWRSGTLIAVFEEKEDGEDEEAGESVSLLACPDSVTFDRMLLGLRWCRRLDTDSPAHRLLSALLTSATTAPNDGGSKHQGSSSTRTGAAGQMGGLNDDQLVAVAMCSGGRDDGPGPVALIHGPFGTGKTKTLVEVIRSASLTLRPGYSHAPVRWGIRAVRAIAPAAAC